jgi:hypothetical protein
MCGHHLKLFCYHSPTYSLSARPSPGEEVTVCYRIAQSLHGRILASSVVEQRWVKYLAHSVFELRKISCALIRVPRRMNISDIVYGAPPQSITLETTQYIGGCRGSTPRVRMCGSLEVFVIVPLLIHCHHGPSRAKKLQCATASRKACTATSMASVSACHPRLNVEQECSNGAFCF